MHDENAAKQLTELANPSSGRGQIAVTMGFGSLQSFELMQRAAKMLAYSTLVPVAYRATKEIKEKGKVVGWEDNPSALPNCVVALNMSQRMGADPLMVMQNLYIVEGRPSWSSQFIIAAINSCGRYSPLRFELSEIGAPKEIKYKATEWVNNQKTEVTKSIVIAPRTCVAWAIELASGDRLESPVVSMDMAVAEGWIQKNGSKWQTMPEVMLRYRAAAFFGKLYAPELLMGLQTAEEAHDIIEVEPQPDGKYAATNLENMRNTGAPEATEQAAQPEPEPGPEPAEPKPYPEPAAIEKESMTDEVRQAYEGVAAQLQKANNLDALAVAADLIQTVAHAGLRSELTAMYKRYLEELSNPQPATKPAKEGDAAPAKRTRRAGSAAAPE